MAMLVDPLLSESISKLFDIIIYVAKTTANFKSELRLLQSTLERIIPIIVDILKLNRELDRTKLESDMFIDEIKDAEKLVLKCLKIKRNYIKKFTHSLKLKDVNNKLLRFFQIEVQADQSRDIKKTLVEVNVVKQTMIDLSSDMKDLSLTLSSGNLSMASSREHVGCEMIARGRLGWRVPVLPRGIVAFDEPLAKLKAKVLADVGGGSSMDCDDGFDDGSVVVVSAPGGCGKTTLVTMLCHDLQTKAKFGESVFFVTVSETPNFMVIANDLYSPNSFGREVPFQSDEDAKIKLENFLSENVSSPILLVLDDVWSESFINSFAFKITGYKLVVTSRIVFHKYDVFKFDPLSDEDARKLFSSSAFNQGKKKPRCTIDESIMNQMVKCCKKHPLTLAVVGSSLNGKDKSVWISMLKALSQGDQSVLDLNKEVLVRLERSFEALDEKIKQCFLDFGLFPEDQRIAASALLIMWVHLYKHDDEGNDTLAKIFELSYRTLVNVPMGNDAKAVVNYCEQVFISQHDLLRELAIHLSSKLPEAKRTRLIINARGEDLPEAINQVKETMQARILSISTGAVFSSKWCDMKVPELEVLVLNIMSEIYALPHFLKETPKLNILNITNYGLYPTEFQNAHFLDGLSNLTTIRLERVAISSLSRSILALANLQKVSFIMCKVGDAFEEHGNEPLTNIKPRLVEIEMDYCQDLVGFPTILCSSVHLKKLSITNCNEMSGLSEEFGKLTNLETLILRSCTKLGKLPETMTRLQKLSVVDISDCLSLSKLPEDVGKLGGLRTIYMKGCTGVVELPPSVAELEHTLVVCSEEISIQWREFSNVNIDVVEEDRFGTLMKII